MLQIIILLIISHSGWLAAQAVHNFNNLILKKQFALAQVTQWELNHHIVQICF